MAKSNIEKFIVSKPWNVGKFNRTFPVGSVLEVDRDKDLFTAEGREFKGLAELKIALNIKDKNTGVAIVMPFSEKSAVVRSILSQVKTRMEEKKLKVQKFKIIQSDSDWLMKLTCQTSRSSRRKKSPDRTGQRT
mgnify:CR=1 FL=1